MGKIVYFDCQNGISGDMTLGALMDAGVELKDLRRELRRLPVKGWTLGAEEVRRGGIAATQAIVKLSKSAKQPHRHYTQIRDMLKSVSLPGKAAARALKAFHLLGKAEAAAHKVSINKVHFHEVGAVDAIIDIVGAMIGLEILGAEQFAASTVVVGSGEVRCSHGVMPVPAPATARLLEGAPIEAGPVAKEMTTPTGASILMSLAPQFGPLPPMQLETTSYGAGSCVIEGRTNTLRLLIGESLTAGKNAPLHAHRLSLLTTEIDDMNPEFFGPLLERLFDAGCRDAFMAPIQMKKGRPAISVQVLAEETKRDEMIEILVRHTSTFGVKAMEIDRYCLRRKMEKVKTDFGAVSVKIGYWGDEVLKVSPEYEDCRRLAGKAGVAIGKVYQSAMQAIMSKYAV